jgi:hypothetical protein
MQYKQCSGTPFQVKVIRVKTLIVKISKRDKQCVNQVINKSQILLFFFNYM